MSILGTAVLVSLMGAVGGLANCFDSGEFHLPCTDQKAGIWRPGWIGIVVVGAAAALVMWGVYGPGASYIIGADPPQRAPTTVSQVLSSVIVGFGGGRFLRMAAEKKADQVTKLKLTEALRKVLGK